MTARPLWRGMEKCDAAAAGRGADAAFTQAELEYHSLQFRERAPPISAADFARRREYADTVFVTCTGTTPDPVQQQFGCGHASAIVLFL